MALYRAAHSTRRCSGHLPRTRAVGRLRFKRLLWLPLGLRPESHLARLNTGGKVSQTGDIHAVAGDKAFDRARATSVRTLIADVTLSLFDSFNLLPAVGAHLRRGLFHDVAV